MNQPTLFQGLARSTDPSTSRDAARKITGRTCWRILDLMRDGTPRTADQIAEAIGGLRSTVHSAVSRCAKDGSLVETGETSLSITGTPMRLYRSTP